MKQFTTNIVLKNSLKDDKKPKQKEEPETLSKEMLQKIKLIEKAFK
jgi:hypothetical protein